MRSADFEEPIHISFGAHGRVLSVVVQETRPNALHLTYRLDQDEFGFTLAPALLNPGDSAGLGVIVANYSEDPKVNARIAGVKELRLAKTGDTSGSIWSEVRKAPTLASAGFLMAMLTLYLALGRGLIAWLASGLLTGFLLGFVESLFRKVRVSTEKGTTVFIEKGARARLELVS